MNGDDFKSFIKFDFKPEAMKEFLKINCLQLRGECYCANENFKVFFSEKDKRFYIDSANLSAEIFILEDGSNCFLNYKKVEHGRELMQMFYDFYYEKKIHLLALKNYLSANLNSDKTIKRKPLKI